MIHILERFIIHFFAGASVYLIALFTLAWWQRKSPEWYRRVIPGIVALAVILPREAFDVAAGQSLIKAVTDWLSWVGGIGMAIWGLYRYGAR